MRKWSMWCVSLPSVFFLLGCGASAVREPALPPQTSTATSAPPAKPAPRPQEASPWDLPEGPRDSVKRTPTTPAAFRLDAWSKASRTKGVAPAPAHCAAFAKRAASAVVPTDLVATIRERDPAKRDAMLVALEAKEPSAGVIRAVRAELAPIECGDALTDPFLATHSAAQGPAGPTLVAISLAAKLSRTAASAPAMKGASDKEKLKQFIQGPLRQWVVEQATAIEALSVPAGELGGRARGIVAIEAGMADLRLVDRIRSSPVPSTWDKELKSVYEAALDEALEPRKKRGRDAALVGLADFAGARITGDARVDRARVLLSKLYGGRRVDALDALMLPREEPSDPAPSVLALQATDAPTQEWFSKLNVPALAPPTSARARFEMGRKYWQRVDFVEAAHAAAKDKDKDPEARLLLALSLALSKGPNGAQEMMVAPSPSALGLGHTEALDALVAEGGNVAGMAAFDAAHLRSLSPPEGDAAGAYLGDVAARFRRAASLLEDPLQKKRAEERAADADAAAKAVGSAKPVEGL